MVSEIVVLAWLPLLGVVVLLATTAGVVAAAERAAATAPRPLTAVQADDLDPRGFVVHPPRERRAAAPAPTPTPTPTPPPRLAPFPTDDPVPLPVSIPPPEEAHEPIGLVPADERLSAFAGLSTWVDLYDVRWTPEEQAAVAAAGGAQAIYVQSARFSSPGPVHDAARLGRLVEGAHDRGLEVMVWYIPDHADPEVDLARAQAAIAFETPRGDRADAFGLDIEMETVRDIGLRNERLLELSRDLREWAGPEYPLAAIVLPPLQLDLRTSWWPEFPYAELADFYDVFVPMSYSTYRGSDAATTYRWNVDNIRELRRRAGDPELPVHLAGGLADAMPHLDAFLEAAADADVLGAGLYDLDITPPAAWPWLRALRVPR